MLEKLSRLIYLWFPPLFLCVVIFYLSATPNLKLGEGTPELIRRKIVHLGEYALLAALFWRALEAKRTIAIKQFFGDKKVLLAILLSSWYGFTDELHQLFIPTREGKIVDGMIDVVGALIGLILIFLIQKRQESHARN